MPISKSQHATRLHIKNQPRRQDNIRSVQTTENERQSSSESSESDYCYGVNTNYNKVPISKLKINGKNGEFTVDTRLNTNIIDETTFKQLQNINLKNARTSIPIQLM